MEHRGAMVPVTDRLINFEHWTARKRRLRYLQWRSSKSSASSSSSRNSYEEFSMYEGAGSLYINNENNIHGQGGLSSSSSASSSSSSASSSSATSVYSSSSLYPHVAADSTDIDDFIIFQGAGSLYNVNDNNYDVHEDFANPVGEDNNYDNIENNDNNPILVENIPVAPNPANPVGEDNNYDNNENNDNNPILEENIPVAPNPDNGDINVHDPDMWLHQLDGKEDELFTFTLIIRL